MYDAFYLIRLSNALIEQTLQRQAIPTGEHYFADRKLIEGNFDIIKEEYLKLRATHELKEFQSFDASNRQILGPNDKWVVLPLKLMGTFVNTDKAPITSALIGQCRGVRNAFFSVLEPYSNLAPHTGNFMSLWRYHLCIDNPAPDASYLFINETRLHWVERESFMFDDMFVHSVVNNSPYPRAILFLDIVRNDLPIHLWVFDYLIHTIATYSDLYKEYVRGSAPIPKLH